MATLHSAAAKGGLSPEEWEERLVFHYLRSDGPSGGAPLTYLDATPAEILLAARIELVDEEAAQRAFLSQFDRGAVHHWLSGAWRPPSRADSVPGYFRYLVLTALVSATDSGAGETQNFRVRLGELLQCEGQFSSVSGVNSLWKGLVDWSSRRRAAGDSIRRIQLPSYGTANLIGYATHIAFPSWGDRGALTRIMRALPAKVRRSPERLVQELSRGRYGNALPAAVRLALESFEVALHKRSRMLLGHRFWRLATSIDIRLSGEDDEIVGGWWQLDVQFGGWEMDVARLKLYCGRSAHDDRIPWEGALQELGKANSGRLPIKLADAFRDGALVCCEQPGLIWRLNEEFPSDDASVLIIARDGGIADHWQVATEWHRLEGLWRRSDRLSAKALKNLRQRLGWETPGVQLIDLVFSEGIRTSRASWLGRPRFLPNIHASPTSKVTLKPLHVDEGDIGLKGEAPIWRLEASSPVSGRWRIHAQEGQNETDRVLCFEREVPERWEFPDGGRGLEVERDVVVEMVVAEKNMPSPPDDRPATTNLSDILEVMYAGPPRGWSEGDLIRLLLPVMPHAHFVWDFLRGLAEADWLQPLVLKSWRGRVWQLRKPYLRDLGPGGVIAVGAIASMARRRLERTVSAMGGSVTYLAGVSEWAVSLPWIRGVNVSELSQRLKWTISSPRWPQIVQAPACWPIEERSGSGRSVAGVWDFDVGLFLPRGNHQKESSLRLERLVREGGDDRDIYRVIDNGRQFISSSRTAAIIESHRRLRIPLFEWSNGFFARRKFTGHLPLEMARALVERASCASGPICFAAGKWGYAYPADLEAAKRIARTLKAAVRVDDAASNLTLLDQLVDRRRRGLHLNWYEVVKSGSSN